MPRTRTPSDLKFLLNERAALAGACAVLEEHLPALGAKVRAAEANLAARKDELSAVQASLASHIQELQAIELTLCAAYPSVRPDASGAVRARCQPGIRARGDLRRLMLDLLDGAAPEAVPTSTLVSVAAARFRWPLVTAPERTRARFMIRNVLRHLREDGLAEPMHSPSSGELGSWRRKVAPSAAEALLELAHEQEQDRAGGEVAGQRAGSSCG